MRSLVRERSKQEKQNGALTAYAREEHRIRVFQSGFQFQAPKLIVPNELVAIVANLYERAETRVS